jgi:sugar phosphate isomerase/epimerase
LKLAFSTLGCPEWTLPNVVRAARSLEYDAIELRALGGSINLLERPEFQPSSIGETKRLLEDQNVAICCLDTSCTFDALDEKTRRENIETALRHCDLAATLNTGLIRVFPDRLQAGASRDETRDNIAACLNEVASRAPSGVRVGLETHGDFASANAATEIVRLAAHGNVALIWDVANALAAGDSIEQSAQGVAPYLAHVHLRDARPVNGLEHWLPVLAGRGNVSFAETVDVLNRIGYDGYISFEWEKYWHPEIEEPEVALPDFAEAMKLILARRPGKVHTSQAPMA